MTEAAGAGYGPDDRGVPAADGFDRSERPFEYQYFHAQGDAQLELPVGEAEVEVIRGTEREQVKFKNASSDVAY